MNRSSNEDEIAQGYRETIILHSIIYQNGSKVLQLIPVLVVVCQYFVSIKCQKCLNYQLRSMVKSIYASGFDACHKPFVEPPVEYSIIQTTLVSGSSHSDK